MIIGESLFHFRSFLKKKKKDWEDSSGPVWQSWGPDLIPSTHINKEPGNGTAHFEPQHR